MKSKLLQIYLGLKMATVELKIKYFIYTIESNHKNKITLNNQINYKKATPMLNYKRG